MFEANKKLDDDEGGDRPGFGVLVSMGKPGSMGKKRPSYNPSAKLDDDEGSGEMGPNERYSEACEILAKMISAGRVEPEKLGQVLRNAFQALEEEPHEEGEHTNEKDEEV